MTIGGLSGLLTAWLLAPGNEMMTGMLLGMVLGMLSQGVSFLVWIPLFGDFEIMIPTMLTGMVSGMLLGMTNTMISLPIEVSSLIGASIGVALTWWVRKRNQDLQGYVQ